MLFSPKCFPHGKERRQQVALTNKGELIPCCWLDQKDKLKHPTMVELLKVSRIDEYEKIEDILETKPWQEFAKNLAEKNMDKIMPVCKDHCKVREGKNRFKRETYIYKGVHKEILNGKLKNVRPVGDEEKEMQKFLGNEKYEKKTNS